MHTGCLTGDVGVGVVGCDGDQGGAACYACQVLNNQQNGSLGGCLDGENQEMISQLGHHLNLMEASRNPVK